MSLVRILTLLAVVASLGITPSLQACPFCASTGQTLLGEVNQAHMIVFGTLSNAKRDPQEFGKGTTDLNIEIVVKDHEYLKGKTTITLPRFVPPDPKNSSKYLVFCEIYMGKLDPYRGEAVPKDSKIAEYLKGAIAIRDKDITARLNYFFRYLDASEWTIASDALMEFGNTEYKDVRVLSEKLPPEKLLKWLKDPNTSPARFGLYGMMLGHCGNTKEHAPELRKMLDDPKTREVSGLDGMLTGYILMDPKAGWEYTTQLARSTKEDFLTRYAALRAMRFFWEFRPDIITKQAIIDEVALIMEQPDISDLAIEDFRKWNRWEMSKKVLALYEKKSHNIPIIQRSIIKFALSSPANDAEASKFLERMRKEQPDRVKDLENLLELEKPKPEKVTPEKTKAEKGS